MKNRIHSSQLHLLSGICSLLLIVHTNAQRLNNTSLTLPTNLPTGSYTTENLYNFTAILGIASPPGATNQLYLAEREGRIQVVSNLAANEVEPTPFLDISSRVTTDLENGLLGFAFHPQYQGNGYFFVFYTTRASGQATNRLSRFTRSANNPLRADPTSELILLDQRDQANNHNGGDIHFGPDGYLYIAVGDEGGGNDSYQNGQRIDKDLFAGLLRIDVDKLPENLEPTEHAAIPRDAQGRAAFSIPIDNPLVPVWQTAGSNSASPLRLEFFAIGLRNPWRFTIDSITGDIWVADVGQNAYEEIDLITKGGNYGWPNREGLHAGTVTRAVPPEFGDFIDPVFEYGHALGNSVTGGIVYRGSQLPELYGAYIFSDFYSNRVWAIRKSESAPPYEAELIASISNAATFGRDPRDGELLAGTITGSLQKLVRSQNSPAPDFPAKLSDTGAFSDLANLTAETGLYAYDVNLPFWSDHAKKSRWISIPAQTQIAYSEDDPWTFPTGSVWIKHFELETDRGNPTSRRRVETRFLVKTNTGAYGLSYQWNDAQTDATLVPEEGSSFEIPISIDSQAASQTWSIPSRQQCLSCHTAAAGYALSFNARQLNRTGIHGGQNENTLQYFSRIGVLDTAIASAENIPRYHAPADTSVSLEKRARSYLAVNCVSCHQPNAGAPTSWDARPHLSLEATRLLDGRAANDGGDPAKRLVTAGSPENSILLDRLANRSGFPRMPPFGSNLIDEPGLDVLTNWIARIGAETAFQNWQIEHFQSTSKLEAAPEEDPDHDGNSNRLEFLNGTLPLNSQSYWRPNFNLRGEALRISFPMAPGRKFLIETSTDLSSWTDWQTAGNPPAVDAETTTNAIIEGNIPTTPPQTFFRVTVGE